MMKTTVAAFGLLALLAGSALAAEQPNDVGITGMGGGTYYNPNVTTQQAVPSIGNHPGPLANH